ncbi:MAG: hypothetical protein K0M55_09485 [Rhizobium sp.]|nr:hypothetical protein [Rhizobium sp.]
MNATMMEASTKPADSVARTVAASPAETHSPGENGAVGEIFSHWLEQAGSPAPSVTMGGQWDAEEESQVPAAAQKSYVPATWLDALGKDHSEPRPDSSDQISAVNSDDNGLYRMFRSVSP